MKSHWRKLISLTPVGVERKLYHRHFQKEHVKWIAAGKRLPVSHASKREALLKLRQQFGLNILVETGTYLGDTLFALYPYFEKLYSIELSEYYYKRASRRFRNFPNIVVRFGDSATEMTTLMAELTQPVLFWLDGHYSGGLTAKGSKECPIYEELIPILASPLRHVVVIDDARLFVGENDYPTLEDLNSFIQQRNPAYSFSVENDSIRLLPQSN